MCEVKMHTVVINAMYTGGNSIRDRIKAFKMQITFVKQWKQCNEVWKTLYLQSGLPPNFLTPPMLC